MAKVLLINGSPNEHGCTYTALHEVEGVLRRHGIETEILWLGRKPVAGCIACNTCARTGHCVFGPETFDDKVNRVRTLGENMAWLLRSIEAGKKAGVPAPQYEPKVATNFIR